VSFVLVVDDDEDLRECLATALRSRGFDVRTAANGLEALDELRHADELPFAILLDLEMPVMSGWELLTELACDAVLADIPVVILSGAADRFSGMAAAVLRKPASVSEVARALSRQAA